MKEGERERLADLDEKEAGRKRGRYKSLQWNEGLVKQPVVLQ